MKALVMKSLLIVGLAVGGAQAEVLIESVTLERPEVSLKGSLYRMPEATDLVILHAGSGPTDRNGNQAGMSSNSLKLLAEDLAAGGVSVLTIDKRGVGESSWAGSEEDMRPSLLIEDLRAWVDWARQHDSEWRVHLLGHSEGALFAKQAAAGIPVKSVISLAGAGRPAGVLLREQTEGRRPGEIGVEFERVLSSLEAGNPVSDVLPILQALFRKTVQPYLIEWLAMDPAAIAAGLETPLLVVGGSTDIQVGRADFDALALHADGTAWIEGMNHVLKEAEGPIAQQLASYTDPTLPLHPDLLPVLLAWLADQ